MTRPSSAGSAPIRVRACPARLPRRAARLRPLGDAARAVDGRGPGASAGWLNTIAPPSPATGSPGPQRPHARAEAEAPARDRAVHRVRGRGGRRQGHADERCPRSTCASRGHDVLVTREPGGTEFGEQLRTMMLDPKTGKLDARSRGAAVRRRRAQHVTTVIRPALAEGKVVICDRYVDSSLAYQGWARGLGEQDVLTLNVWATQGLFPDLVILLHVEPELGLLRSTEAARPHRAGGPGLPREGRRRVPEDRRGAPRAVRRRGRRQGAVGGVRRREDARWTGCSANATTMRVGRVTAD